MNIKDGILRLLGRRKNNVLRDNLQLYGTWQMTKLDFATCVFYNICDLLTDLCNDVTWRNLSGGDVMKFAAFKRFFESSGKYVLNMLFTEGYVVIGYVDYGFWLMSAAEYTTSGNGKQVEVIPNNADVEVYVMKSDTFKMYGVSDRQLCGGTLKILDNALNASNTIVERLGTLLVGTPKDTTGGQIEAVLSKEEKQEIEKELQRDYGALSQQNQILLFTKALDLQTINFAGLDQKTMERVKMAVEIICDRIKVPANQVSLIDANSSKSLSNGSEIREGDIRKYQSFERLLYGTFGVMAERIGLKVEYTIYNKPTMGAATV